jgi:hypothetical protein
MTDLNRIRPRIHLHQLSLRLSDLIQSISPSIESNNSGATHLGPRMRFSALLPALHLLKDALPVRTILNMQQTLQPRLKIKVLSNNLHLGTLRTDDVMHPNRDPFSRARIPYLECSPPRTVKSSIVELVRDWENVNIFRYSADAFKGC